MPLTLVRQDIAKMKVDVIVNAANTELQIGGVCGAVFRAEGASALSENGNAWKWTYSAELRQRVVEEYLSGLGSSMSIAEKYKLRSGNLVLDWAKWTIVNKGDKQN